MFHSRDTLFGALLDVAQSHADVEAIVCGTRRLTYAQLRIEVERVARAMLASGVKHGDRVAMLATTRLEFFTVFLATAAIGAIWVGLGIRNRLDELRYIVADAEPDLLIGIDEFEGRDYRPELLELQRSQASIRELIVLGVMTDGLVYTDWIARHATVSNETFVAAARTVAPLDAALLVYTSGTTGRPKGAVLSHLGLVAGNRAQLSRVEGLRPIALCAFPINHIACVGDTCVANLLASGTTILTERFRPEEQLELIQRERVNLWGGIPTMVQMTLDLPDFARYDLSSIRRTGWGGSPMPSGMIPRMRALTPALYNVYGSTETTVNVTWTDPGASDEVLANTIGRPPPEFPCRIVSDDGAVCGVGDSGELQFRSPTNMLGYWRRPEATQAAFTADGWLRTGDIGYWREDGNITLVGRRAEMFKSGGFNVYPREVELALETHPQVALAAVISQPDPLYSEVGKAYVVATAGAKLDSNELSRHARERLANYKVPKIIQIVAEIPVLANGKIDKQALRAASAV